jgi:PPOX class probable F420-dependent enzyme
MTVDTVVRMDQQDLATAKYVALTTYKRDGSTVSNPMWLIGADGTYEMMTEDNSFKVTRIRNNPAVTLQVSDAKGNPAEGSTVYSGIATLLTGVESTMVVDQVKAKYGIAAKLISVVGKITGFLKRRPSGEKIGIRISVD